MTKRILFVLISVLLCSVLFFLFIFRRDLGEQIPQEKESITISWTDWPPAYLFEELTKEFTKETGINVNFIIYPIPDWQTGVFGVLEEKKTTFDLIVGDSQWLGRGAREGHYIDVTKWIKEHGVDKTMVPAAIKGYGEFPKGSGRYWAIPMQGDAMGWAYRKDLFEDPKEKADFKEKYGYELGVPESWEEIRDIAEFFHRPDEKLYGVGLDTSKDYDTITMGVQNVFFSMGGDYGDENYRVKGILNSEKSVKGLEFFKELYKFTPPNWGNAPYGASADAFLNGNVALVNTYFAAMLSLRDNEDIPYEIAFFPNPTGPHGDDFTALGGQGLSLIAYSKNKEAALKFMEWFVREENQKRWAELGGFPCDENVLTSEGFIQKSSFNEALSKSMVMLKDFWAVPEYDKLLTVSQRALHEYIVNDDISAEYTLDHIADEWEEVFEYAGYYKE